MSSNALTSLLAVSMTAPYPCMVDRNLSCGMQRPGQLTISQLWQHRRSTVAVDVTEQQVCMERHRRHIRQRQPYLDVADEKSCAMREELPNTRQH